VVRQDKTRQDKTQLLAAVTTVGAVRHCFSQVGSSGILKKVFRDE
jgi:hypothetical protein